MRLGVLGEWDNPYHDPHVRSLRHRQVEIFGEMAQKGHIYKGLKPVHWCPDCGTALAEAEIEYAEDPCYSVYVKFAVKRRPGQAVLQLGARRLARPTVVIWTTTTWTLPGKRGHLPGTRSLTTALLKANREGETEYYAVAKELAANATRGRPRRSRIMS